MTRRKLTSRLALFWNAALLLCPLFADAETPALDYLFPAGSQYGTTNTVIVGGKFEPWPPNVWIDCPGVRFEPETNKGNFKILIETNAPVGPHLVRLFNSDGASAPKCFVIGSENEAAEIEPNDNWKQAQRIDTLPVTLNGRLEKSGDVDSFAVRLEAGKWLIATMDAYALGSPIDPNLSLLDDEGNRVGFNSDGRQSLDPLLEWKVAKSGLYVLQVSAFVHPPAADVRLAGSPASVYRLRITQSPVVSAIFPPCVPRDSRSEVELFYYGTPLEREEIVRLRFESPIASSGPPYVTVPESMGKLRVAVSELPTEAEHEPNNSVEHAQRLHWPVTINGRIDPPGDEDRFVFDSKKGDKLEFRLRSGALGLALDGAIRVENANAKQVMGDDDAGEAFDPLLGWTTPSNGTYCVVISDLYRRGGPEFAYALEVQVPVPDFKVTVDSSAFRIEPGKTNDLKLTINRLASHTNNLEAIIVGLPDSVTSRSAAIGGKDKEAKLSLIAAADAKPFSGPFQIEVTDAANKSISHRATFDLGPKESRSGEFLISRIDQFWLTVSTNVAAPAKPKTK